MKKQHLDPNAKRDFSVLSEEDKKEGRAWLQSKNKSVCPFTTFICFETGREICKSVFPEIIRKNICPCHVLFIKDVIKIARKAVR